jgi:hypothetical protein
VEGGGPAPTLLLKPVVTTIERSLVLRKIGRLEEEDRRALRKMLDEILGS